VPRRDGQAQHVNHPRHHSELCAGIRKQRNEIMTRQRDDKDLEAQVPLAELSECDLEKATGGSRSSGSGAGRVLHGDMQVQKYLDKASVIL
jgi:hypothetical protein